MVVAPIGRIGQHIRRDLDGGRTFFETDAGPRDPGGAGITERHEGDGRKKENQERRQGSRGSDSSLRGLESIEQWR